MHIRPCTPDDAAAVWDILKPLIRAGEVFALPRDMSGAAALAYWTGGDHEAFVAELEGAIAGAYYIRPNQQGGGGHVANAGYATAAGVTGRGVARAMCRTSLDQARERGFTAMQFNFVVATNTRAVKLWQDCGFAIAGRLPGAFAHPHHGLVEALVMHRAL